MRTFAKGILWLLVLVLLAGIIFFFDILPKIVDKKSNKVAPHAPYEVSEQAKALHKTLRVADLHSDMLLWNRDHAKRQTRGHTDLVRLREGNVALQVFATVTFVPKDMNETANTANKDAMTALTVAQRWPRATWTSLFERAKYQAQRLQNLEEQSGGDFVFARTQSDLRAALEARTQNKNIIVGVMETEGAHPLEGKIENVGKLYDEGFRMFGLQHFFDNELGGSLHGVSKAGLSPFGREVVKTMTAKGMIIDIAHSSVQTVKDVFAMSDAPMLISHTGIVSLCEHPKRNIPDHLLSELANRGGLIGIGYWEMAVCDTRPEGIAKMIIHGVEKFGVDHIALGSDFDGATTVNFDTSELVALTDVLLKQGMSEVDIRKVMGENQITFFLKNLPN